MLTDLFDAYQVSHVRLFDAGPINSAIGLFKLRYNNWNTIDIDAE